LTRKCGFRCSFKFCSCTFCFIAVAFVQVSRALEIHLLQVNAPMLWIFTIVQRNHGQSRNSALLEDFLQRRLLGTWFYSRAVTVQEVRSEKWSALELLFTTCFLRSASCSTNTAWLKLFATGYPFDVVDLYDSVTGTWSTASLSVARYYLAATSVGNVALFAGGNTVGELLRH
jgi:hypothetical protein